MAILPHTEKQVFLTNTDNTSSQREASFPHRQTGNTSSQREASFTDRRAILPHGEKHVFLTDTGITSSQREASIPDIHSSRQYFLTERGKVS
jgi:hypothetical protein